MTPQRFQEITVRYRKLRIAVVGDFCLDRYLEIDPTKHELSIETGLRVHNVLNIRSQPGAAGTVLNNLVALGVGEIYPIGFCGEDGEGYELQRALAQIPSVNLKHFVVTRQRRTFTYTKPLVLHRGKAPWELNRLDIKNWTRTPGPVADSLAEGLGRLARKVDAMIVLDQTPLADTGVVTSDLLKTLRKLGRNYPKLLILADSRRSLRNFPPLVFKMNRDEMAAFVQSKRKLSFAQVRTLAHAIAKRNGRPVFVTLAERGILAADPNGNVVHMPSLKLRGPIDIVGAGDAVSGNLTTALAAGASLAEAIALANAAASLVIHQLGTTGTASVGQIRELCFPRASSRTRLPRPTPFPEPTLLTFLKGGADRRQPLPPLPA
jgi:rfaE bifunctional protein kinase chain/domain